MNIREYAKYDATGLAELVRKKEVTPKELALTAARAIAKANPELNGVIETYDDRINGLDEKTLGNGPFRGVPLLMKDVFGHEKGRTIEYGSRLCAGMTVEEGTYFVDMLKAAGVNILGRSAAPEYSSVSTARAVPWSARKNSRVLTARFSAASASGVRVRAVAVGRAISARRP